MSKKIKKNVLEILKDPNPLLHAANREVSTVEFGKPWLVETSQNMIHTMRTVRGLGLAAPQVGINVKMTVALIDKVPVVIVNPVILSKAEETISIEEGCLSCPGVDVRILRPAWIEVKYNSINGKEFIRLFGGMSSIIVSHELDHLEGRLITNYFGGDKDADHQS